ncbi:Acyl-CoA dehydrogenase [Dehalogenimonas alkenigignens]|uniref:Acyl-CoA dehydrogenase n=1 Tax=Dehalogenimonas alkenigignens TaxID=1217799 RepID=A0A0W0GK72_9CHLR|nr:acyl-CoA dehydrogenase family protein [Dehalogenimonas alkenigignens]KTB48936.1 Acyl-CoA dehydrogenase [Dehalogenimonas alkenigignens]
MEYFLNELQTTVRDLARGIAEEKVLPVRAELDEKEEFPWAIVREIAASGLYGIAIPEEYGGIGGGSFELVLAAEQLARVCGGVAVTYAANFLGSDILIDNGSPEQKARFLPDIASGEKLCAFAITEETAGSDAGAVKTTATKTVDGYVINGSKRFITNGGDAAIYTIIARTEPGKSARGLSAFIVEKGTPGFSFGRKEKKMGIRTSSTRELLFDDCLIPRENLIGKEGMGFFYAMKLFEKSRPGIGAQALGIAQGAFEAAYAHAKERVQFGEAVLSFQAIQHMLANMAMDIEAARALIYASARTIDSGLQKSGNMESSMSKVFASDMAMRVTTDAVQIMGGVGYMRDYPAEKFMRDAKITQMYEGTNQILRNIIANELKKRY